MSTAGLAVALSLALLQDADAGDKIAAAEDIAQFVVTAPPSHAPEQCVDFPATAVDFLGDGKPWLLVRSECAQLSGRDPDDGLTTLIALRAADAETPFLVLDSQAEGAEMAGQFDRLEVLTLSPSRRQVVFLSISSGGSGSEVAWGLLGSVAGKVQVVPLPDLIAAATERKLMQPGEELACVGTEVALRDDAHAVRVVLTTTTNQDGSCKAPSGRLVFDLSLDGLRLTAASRQPPWSAAERRVWERLKAKRHTGKRRKPRQGG